MDACFRAFRRVNLNTSVSETLVRARVESQNLSKYEPTRDARTQGISPHCQEAGAAAILHAYAAAT